MNGRPAMLLVFLVASTATMTGESAHLNVSESRNWIIEARGCTVDELLPKAIPENASVSSEWSKQRVVEPLYGCDCAQYRGRYFCPHLGNDGYQTWVPHAVADGTCHSVPPSQLAEAPLPPDFKVLMYGNSHLRQVVESIMCIFHEHVSTKRVKYYDKGPDNVGDRYLTIDGSTQCRSCAPFNYELAEYKCLSRGDAYGDACTCSDDIAEFFFANGAVLQYYYAGDSTNKHVREALPHFNVSSFSDYDAVFANNGNDPIMKQPQVLAVAEELNKASVPFFWLSTYGGRGGHYGDVDGWNEQDRVRMDRLGVNFIRVGVMARGLDRLLKALVEPGSDDNHFCLPGPPNEMALLLLKILWALHDENTGDAE